MVLTELYKYVLRWVEGHLLKVLADQDLDRMLVPVLGDVLAHEVRL